MVCILLTRSCMERKARKEGSQGLASMELEGIVYRVREEFREMPGLRLTPAQATRLWGLEHEACRKVIDVLVAAEFLRWTPSGSVTRAGT